MGRVISTKPRLACIDPPRLLAGLDETYRLDRVGHLTVHGSMPALRADELVALAENIDLRGRGGAGFPFAKKLTAVMESAGRRDGRCAVVVNGSEGEPSCLKDTALLLHTPHLVIDGAVLAATALGADDVAIAVHRPDVEESLNAAIAERGPSGPRVQVSVTDDRFVAGEGGAVINGISGAPAIPNGRKIRTSDSGLAGLPTLLSNTETYAQLAVAARMGALPFRSVGLPTEPGTTLLTVGGKFVMETPFGVPLSYVLELCGLTPGQGVLVGGYHGKWLLPDSLASVNISRESMEKYNARLGAGAVLPIPENTCPVGETARVARWLAGETANQCGPCFIGLPALADAIGQVERGGGQAALDSVSAYIESVKRRGACSHPDGTAGFVTTALDAFPDEFREHALGPGCGRPTLGVLPLTDGASSGPLALPPGPSATRRDERDASEQLLVDWTLCQGHGLCADILPEVIELGIDGYPHRAKYGVPRQLRGQAVRAVRRCPALALRLEE
ncbi:MULTISPECIES: NADH-ubiquinone oxidoreductase-F iron-sulfur binding region domain-containing protein [Streptomyces]|uniref:NADH-ubiquinone oxidoreductase-F iron-sulfur binding region domain-containing protein n=1 Tax=Streptomyces lonegramiae TaxID=3075524 RepID=A0ABU2XVY5_9ACTN|nr:NADH-ubiquinone oxidoreductase-F iron-sulfur binding region domain-containing protein [Streptomyces sp. DSM 41529]MDT0550071.1 NADH-ubiquinone oxidoreductase-F iron-sulfur binding region domain-containing protein [Streptomyces sp. DSM 41529]